MAESKLPAGVAVPRAAVAEGVGLTSERARQRMVERVQAAGVGDAGVLRALEAVPRHHFVDAAFASRAYEDVALPIGHAQTISRPTVVGRMLEVLLAGWEPAARRAARVLEIGTGCGYQAVVLAQLFGEVYSIERIRALHEMARAKLRPFRLASVRLVFGDGQQGIESAAPFDGIVIAAAGLEVPEPLLRQMRVGARLVAPVGAQEQSLHLIERAGIDDWRLTVLDGVRFVPLRSGTS
ncbi:MAG: protein-L-isoaspartate(D-aspartate) O-methyltransferase [Burkholderiales bacterium]|nr:MAG: protein-L-isoaspartate(D-aspartate) O-methyltransferase [Burkholderiales bacterium]